MWYHSQEDQQVLKHGMKGAGYNKREVQEALGPLPGFPQFSGFRGLVDSSL